MACDFFYILLNFHTIMFIDIFWFIEFTFNNTFYISCLWREYDNVIRFLIILYRNFINVAVLNKMADSSVTKELLINLILPDAVLMTLLYIFFLIDDDICKCKSYGM